jgi:hypothetical protein
MASWNKILCIPVALMILIAVTVVPTMACSPFTPCGQTPIVNGNGDTKDWNVVEKTLTKSESKKIITDVLKNDTVKELSKMLIARGYTPDRSDATIVQQVIVSNTTLNIDATIVNIPFKSHGSNVQASIMWVSRNGVVSIDATLKGTAEELSTPLDILKLNETYQSYKSDWIAQGFSVFESNATVTEAFSLDYDKAFVEVSAANETVNKIVIAGIVDLEIGSVLSVVDLDWGCEACTIIIGYLCAMGLTNVFNCVFMQSEELGQ